MGSYENFARVYDELMDNVPYEEWADFILAILKKNKISKREKEIVFDLIKGALSEVDVNFGAVKNSKEVNEIINQLKEEFENN